MAENDNNNDNTDELSVIEHGNTTNDQEARDMEQLDELKKRLDADDAEHDDHGTPADHVRDTVPWKIHVLIAERPCLWCLFFCGWFVICGLIVAFVPGLLVFSTDVPFYIRDNKPTTLADALAAGKEDASWERQTSDTAEKQQEITADVDLQLIYIGNGANLAQEKYLKLMDEIEEKIISASGYQDVCNRLYDASNDSVYKCNRRSSITNFFDRTYFKPSVDQNYTIYPSLTNLQFYFMPSAFIDGSVDLENKDYSEENIEEIVSYWAGYDQGHGPTVPKYSKKYYNGVAMPSKFTYQNLVNGQLANFSVANLFAGLAGTDFAYETPLDTKVGVALSTFQFGLPLSGYESASDDTDSQGSDIGKWCYDELHDILTDFQKEHEDDFTFYWSCSNMGAYYSEYILIVDGLFMILTFLSVYTLMIINTGSVWLASCGMAMIFMNFLPAVLLYRYINGLKYFGTLLLMSMFIILSIGADDVFVICDTWAQYRTAAPDEDMAKRLTATLKHAGKVMMTTSLSTCFSFIGNTTSVFPAVYTFGAFSAWLIFVNYCSVVIFYPTVLAVHDMYFYTPKLKRGCCKTRKMDENASTSTNSKCCGFDNEKVPDCELDEEDRKRGIDKFFEYKFFPFILRKRKQILGVTFWFFLVFFSLALRLAPDPDVPQFFPDGNSYQEFNGAISDNFASENLYQMTGEIVWGIDTIDRKGTDDTLVDDIGEVVYAENVSFYRPREQEYIAQFCDDLLCQYSDYECRYSAETYENLWISDPANYGDERINIVKCFMTEFRTFVEEDLAATPNKSEIAEILIDYNITDLTADAFDDCEFGVFPVEGVHCFALLFQVLWLNEELPTSNPDYVAGTSNYDYWKSNIWVKDVSNDDDEAEELELKFFTVTVKTEIEASTNYVEGIELYLNWQDFIKMWEENDNGINSVDQYGNDYLDTPQSLQSIKAISGLFSYFYTQRQIIDEAIIGIGVSLSLALLVLTVATGNWAMALYSTFTIGAIVICVMGFTTLNGWKLGVIEAVIYVMVVGMSVDYVVHLSEAYLVSGKYHREARARRMLGIVGGSVLSGAMSTLIGIFWLFFATVVMMYKFGAFIFFLISVSCIVSLISFTAAMTLIGPEGEFGDIVVCYKKIRNKYFKRLQDSSSNNKQNTTAHIEIG